MEWFSTALCFSPVKEDCCCDDGKMGKQTNQKGNFGRLLSFFPPGKQRVLVMVEMAEEGRVGWLCAWAFLVNEISVCRNNDNDNVTK